MRRRIPALLLVLALAAILAAEWTAGHDRSLMSLRIVAVDEMGGGDATIAPDGRRFATTSRRSGDWEVWIFDIEAQRWTQVTHEPGEDFEAKWSPDGTGLVFTSSRTGHKDIWTVDLRSGKQRRLTSSPEDDEYPAWSPDGKWIVYTGGPWNSRDIFIVSPSGGPARRVTKTSGQAGACTFESGSETLVCHRYDSGSGDLMRLWISDGAEAPLTAGSGWDYKPTASPDGKLVAFSRAIEGPSHIWLLPAQGGRPWSVTGGDSDDRWPTWSGDSTRILFHRSVDESLGVERIDRTRDEPPTIVVPASERPLQSSLHPDGRTIAYCAETSSGRRVKVSDIATGAVRIIDTGPGDACYPRWSPGGDRLALTARRADRWEVAVAKPDGTALRLLTSGRKDLRGMDGPVDWSPDGTRVIFHSDTAPFEARLYTADVASGAIEAVTGPGFFDESPSWSPDGRDILFMSTRGGNWTWALYRLTPGSGTPVPFTDPDWVEKNFPRASGDGGTIWTAADANGVQRLMEQRGGSAAVVPRSGAGARWPSYSSDGRFITYTRLAHRIEYWVVDNPAVNGAPKLHTTPRTADALEGHPARPSRGSDSPHGFHRR